MDKTSECSPVCGEVHKRHFPPKKHRLEMHGDQAVSRNVQQGLLLLFVLTKQAHRLLCFRFLSEIRPLEKGTSKINFLEYKTFNIFFLAHITPLQNKKSENQLLRFSYGKKYLYVYAYVYTHIKIRILNFNKNQPINRLNAHVWITQKKYDL